MPEVRFWPAWLKLSGVIWGLLVGLAAAGLVHIKWVYLLVLAGPMLVVPLGLSLVPEADPPRFEQIWIRLLKRLHPIAALCAMIVFFLERGAPGTAWVAGVWAAYTLLLFVYAFIRLFRFGLFNPAEVAVCAGLGFVLVGGSWFLFAAAGMNILGFNGLISWLTAGHFHHAAFGCCLLMGFLGRFWGERPLLYGVAVWLQILAIIAVGVGITFWPVLEFVGAAALCLVMWALAHWLFWKMPGLVRTARTGHLFRFAAVSVAVSMVLALMYAYGEYTGNYLIYIPGMIRRHASLNVLGFLLPALLGFHLAAAEKSGDA